MKEKRKCMIPIGEVAYSNKKNSSDTSGKICEADMFKMDDAPYRPPRRQNSEFIKEQLTLTIDRS